MSAVAVPVSRVRRVSFIPKLFHQKFITSFVFLTCGQTMALWSVKKVGLAPQLGLTLWARRLLCKLLFLTFMLSKGPFLRRLRRSSRHSITCFDARLSEQTAELAKGFPVVCAFANDKLSEKVLEALKAGGTRLIALRSAGFNNVDLKTADRLQIKVVRVPAYSPYSVAEHAVALILALNRKVVRASSRVHELNFSLDGLVGFDLFEKTVGVIGTGRIGLAFAKIMNGFGCKVLGFDEFPKPSSHIQHVDLDELLAKSDIISLHVPLTPKTRHLFNRDAFGKMKPGAYLINTGRGALIQTKDLIEALKSGRLGGAGLDVYEEEENIFFHDLSGQVLQDDQLARLLTFPNVLITAHQGFLTREALTNIMTTTLQNIEDFENGKPLVNEVKAAT